MAGVFFLDLIQELLWMHTPLLHQLEVSCSGLQRIKLSSCKSLAKTKEGVRLRLLGGRVGGISGASNGCNVCNSVRGFLIPIHELVHDTLELWHPKKGW